MNDSEERSTTHIVIENELQKRNLDGWTRSNKIALVVTWLVVIAVFMYNYGFDATNIGAALVYAIFTALCLRPLTSRRRLGWGRGHEEVSYAVKSWRLMMRKGREGLWWREPTEPGSDPEGIAQRVIPVEVAVIPARDLDKVPSRIPLLHQLDRPYDQLFIRAKGGAFASLDGEALYNLNHELAEVFDRTLSMTELHAGIACLQISTPVSDHEFAVEMSLKGSPLLMARENFQLDETLQGLTALQHEYLGQLIPAMQNKGAKETWGLIVITIRRGGEWRGASKGKLSDDELYNLPVLELGRTLVEDLQSNEVLGLSDVHILKPHELYRLARISWDVFGIQPFNTLYNELSLRYAAKTAQDIASAQEAKGPETLTEQEIADITVENDRQMFDELKAQSSCWPREIVSVNNACLRMNENYISVIRIEKVPKSINQDEYLSQLRMTPLGEWTRRCYGGESVSGEMETLAIMGKQAQAQSWFGIISDKLSIVHPKIQRIEQELAEKAQLASHYTIAQLSSKYWAVVAPSEPLNRKQTKALMADLKTRGFKSRIVKLPALHIDAFLTAALAAARM